MNLKYLHSTSLLQQFRSTALMQSWSRNTFADPIAEVCRWRGSRPRRMFVHHHRTCMRTQSSYARKAQHTARGQHNINHNLKSTTSLLALQQQQHHEPRQFQQRRTYSSPSVVQVEHDHVDLKTPRVLLNDHVQSQEILIDFHNVATRYPSFWLRDHCLCEKCMHPQTRQRQVDTFALSPGEMRAQDIEVRTDGLMVRWSAGDKALDHHHSVYPWNWLREHTPFGTTTSTKDDGGDDGVRGIWQTVSPSGPFPSVTFQEAMTTDAGLHTMLSQIRTYGMTFVRDTPATSPQPTQDLAHRIAFIRQTHYGGFWEVVSEANPIDTAYTNLYLPNHTDNTYFTDPCGLQMFHCLSHTRHPNTTTTTTSISSSSPSSPSLSSPQSSSADTTIGQIDADLGGESTFVDGFAAARKLHTDQPEYYRALSNVCIRSHASGDDQAGPIFNDAVHSSGYPVFTHSLQSSSSSSPQNKNNTPKYLSQIRWNNSDRHSSTSFANHQAMRTWYAAAKAWNTLIHSAEFEITVKLVPGTVVVFDNWRVLHGRKSFEGVRRLCGAYVGMDDFLAKARLLDARVGKGEGGSGKPQL